MRNKLIKALAAATFAVVGMGVTGTVNSSNTAVQASTFHYLRKDHKLVTLGLGQNLPVREYNHGKLLQKDDPSNEDTYCDFNVLKTRGWKYINGQKYYNVPNQKTLDATSAYINAKYFTKKYNDLSYAQVYTVTKAFSPLNSDMQASRTNLTLAKGANIEVDMYSKDNKIVSMSSPINSKYGLKGVVDDGGHNMSMWLKMTQSQFRNNCRKAAPNAKFVMNNAGDYETNASLARGGIYHKGRFYKVYTR